MPSLLQTIVPSVARRRPRMFGRARKKSHGTRMIERGSTDRTESENPTESDIAAYLEAIVHEADARALADVEAIFNRNALNDPDLDEFDLDTDEDGDDLFGAEGASPSTLRRYNAVDGKPPPASDEAITRLPHARVFPFDKVPDNATLSCGVCCERLIDGVALSRLPCGHIYHINCIVGWLSRTCTCPECRYELQTNDAVYEVGRQERMKNRRIVTCSCHPSGHHSCFFKLLQELQVETNSDAGENSSIGESTCEPCPPPVDD